MATKEEVERLMQDIGVKKPIDKVGSNFVLRRKHRVWSLPEAEVDQFLNLQAELSIGPETAVSTRSYYEQVVDMQRAARARVYLFNGEQEQLVLKSETSTSQIELSPISTHFILQLLAEGEITRLHRAFRPPIRHRRPPEEEGPQHLRKLYRGVLTVKVRADRPWGREKLQHVAEAGLFHISYSRSVALSLLPTWARERQRLIRRRERTIQFPQRLYDRELLAYYYLALSSESHILKYLSFYQVLEFFFTSSSDRVLHRRLANTLSQPGFTPHDPAKLRDLTTTVRRLDQKTDERRMLRNVLEQHFEPDELIDWIASHNKSHSNHFTDPINLFGREGAKLDITSPDAIAASIASRIYHVRNILVHNKEGELPRFIPFSEHDELLAKELPLVQYLGEQLVIRTGEDFT